MEKTIANLMQVGGDHYKAEVQHWDWTTPTRIQGLEYASTKYLSRWWKKNGLEDITKPIHYMVKAKEMHLAGKHFNHTMHTSPNYLVVEKAKALFDDFIDSSDIPDMEANIMLRIATWQTTGQLNTILSMLDQLYRDASEGRISYFNPSKVGLPPAGASKAITDPASGSPDRPDPTGQANPFGYVPGDL